MTKMVLSWIARIVATLVACAITTVIFSIANGLPNDAGSDVGGGGCLFLIWALLVIWLETEWSKFILMVGGMVFGFIALVGVLIWLSHGITIQVGGAA